MAKVYGESSAISAKNFLDLHLVSLPKILGINNVKVIWVESTTTDEATLTDAWSSAKNATAQIF